MRFGDSNWLNAIGHGPGQEQRGLALEIRLLSPDKGANLLLFRLINRVVRLLLIVFVEFAERINISGFKRGSHEVHVGYLSHIVVSCTRIFERGHLETVLILLNEVIALRIDQSLSPMAKIQALAGERWNCLCIALFLLAMMLRGGHFLLRPKILRAEETSDATVGAILIVKN